MPEYENDVNSTVVVKIKRKRKNWTIFVGSYRQWKGTASNCTYNSRSLPHFILRMKDLIKLYEDVANLSLDQVIAGDLNIDRFKENNPEQRKDIKNLIPMLEDFMAEFNVVQMNIKTTRHRIGERSTTLDLFLTNIPAKCSQWKNVENLTSEHDGVAMTVKIDNIVKKPQFMVVRNTKLLNASNILEELKKMNNFTDEEKSDDVDVVAEGILKKLNVIAKKLAPTKRVQIKKHAEKIHSQEARNLFDEAKQIKVDAIKNKCKDDFRLAKNMLNRAIKVNNKAEAERIKEKLKHDKHKWQEINANNDNDKSPTALTNNGDLITYQKEISNVLAKHFKESIEEIRNTSILI